MLGDSPRQYVAYVRGRDDAVTLALGQPPDRSYLLQQFDPGSGRFKDIATYSAGTVEYRPPDRQDWVVPATRVGQ